MASEKTTPHTPESLKDILTQFTEKYSNIEEDPSSDFSDLDILPPKNGQKKVSKIPEQQSFIDDFETDDDPEDGNYFSKPVNSAFDINIAEFPIAYLNRGRLPKNANKTEIQYSDTIKGRNGEPVQRVWTVEAHSTIDRKESESLEKKLGRKLVDNEKKVGFGGPQTLEVVYELFQLWKEQDFKDPKIHIGTYYHFLKRLGWCTGKSDYQLLKKTLKCIHGIHIKAENALYLPALDRYENREFYLFPSLRTYTKSDKETNPDDYLYITVDEDFYKAVKAKTTYFIPFDRFYFKTLKPMEQKLGLMLAKVFTPYKRNQRFQWQRKIENVANQIPILAINQKHIKMQLKRTCDGLIEKNFPFLSKYSIDGDVITFYNNIQTSLHFEPVPVKEKKDYDTVEWLISEQMKICGDEHSKPFYSIIAKNVPVELIYQALSEAKQEGKVKAKLYTKRILEIGAKYLEPYLKKTHDLKNNTDVIAPSSVPNLVSKKPNSQLTELIELTSEEIKLIELDLEKDKESFIDRSIGNNEITED